MMNTDLLDSNVLCDSSVLNIDEACFKVTSTANASLELWMKSDECHLCDYVPWKEISPYGNFSLVVKTIFPVWFYYFSHDLKWCTTRFRFKEHGIYGWNISDYGGCSSVYTVKEPPLPYLSILVVTAVLLLVGLLWQSISWIANSEWLANMRARNTPFSELENDLGSPNPGEAPPIVRNDFLQIIRRQNRVTSLDVFRGISITMMIFVNYGGGHYIFFKHSVWNGLTVADLVFPWFAWIMGVSLAVSLRTHLRSGEPRLALLLRVLRRSAVLIALGVALNSTGPPLPDVRILRLPGVLQRLGLCYLLVGTLECLLMSREGAFRYGRYVVAADVLESWPQWLVVLAIVGIHSGITFGLKVPGCPTGYLGPGGLHHRGMYQNCTGGAAGYIDRLLLTPDHMYSRPTCKNIYKTNQPYDPEGILGTLTSVLTVYLGVHAGRILQCFNYTFMRIFRWVAWAVLTGLVAGGLCNFSKDDGIIPVNKNLWSLSFSLATASFAFLLISLLYFVVDSRRWWSGSPFVFAGMNPLVLYVGHELTRHMFPWSWKPVFNNHPELLVMHIWGTLLWLLIAYIMYRKDVFISV